MVSRKRRYGKVELTRHFSLHFISGKGSVPEMMRWYSQVNSNGGMQQ